ncbi:MULTISPECIES: thioredoxin family protein [Bacillota]|uniref:thioredoxin family protein n=1 Tax=Bacillota TaxID=1239 RepID=UPI0021D4A54B|nr:MULTISPECIES: thioredoxin family protein [Bacillota]MCU7208235.1 thioredoxin family protein [Turicibacter sp. GALT-G1]
MKLKKYIIIAILAIIIPLSIYNICININPLKTHTNIANDVSYDNFSKKIDNIDTLLEDNLTGFVYFGRDTCSNCLNFNGLLGSLLLEYNQLIIYKFDTDVWRNHEKFNNILKKYNISEIPTLINIKKDGSYHTFKHESTDNLKENLTNFLLENSN